MVWGFRGHIWIVQASKCKGMRVSGLLRHGCKEPAKVRLIKATCAATARIVMQNSLPQQKAFAHRRPPINHRGVERNPDAQLYHQRRMEHPHVCIEWKVERRTRRCCHTYP